MAAGGEGRGIRISELQLAGLRRRYGVSFKAADGMWMPLSVIAGQSQTGKTSVIDFIRYCLGSSEYPEHPEIAASVKAALLETTLAGKSYSIERSAAGQPSRFASLWNTPIAGIAQADELRVVVEPTSDPGGLSQFLLAACGLDNIALPEAPTQTESATDMLSIRDLMRVISVPNERLDNKNLVLEQSNHMVKQKLVQTIDAIFGVHDSAGADLSARIKLAAQAAAEASRHARSLKEVVEAEHPLGPLVLQTDLERQEGEVRRLHRELREFDDLQAEHQNTVGELRQHLAASQARAREAAVRVRDRESLVERLTALRGQYADDRKKLTFLKEAERLFDPLHLTVCPACLSSLPEPPTAAGGVCSMCKSRVTPVHPGTGPGDQVSSEEAPGVTSRHAASGVIEAEYRAVSKRLDELNDYLERLSTDLQQLRAAADQATSDAEAAANAVNRMVELPAPYLASRDGLAERVSRARLGVQQTSAGIRLWSKVGEAEARAERALGLASRLRAEQREDRQRPDRSAVVRALSDRFGAILSDIGYPKLSNPYLDDKLTPHVRNLPYTAASSGGLVLISLAWHLAIWEVAYENSEHAPGLLIIDSPQKNLGHKAHTDDEDFADAKLVDNFYAHAAKWLGGDGKGAQLIVVDNTPPEVAAANVVVRYTRNRDIPPYGLIEDAVD